MQFFLFKLTVFQLYERGSATVKVPLGRRSYLRNYKIESCTKCENRCHRAANKNTDIYTHIRVLSNE